MGRIFMISVLYDATTCATIPAMPFRSPVRSAGLDDPAVERARALVLRHGWNAMAYQILNPGMRLWFSADGEAVAGYVCASNYRVVAGGPVCVAERLAEVAAELSADTRRAGQRLCYFGAQERLTDLLAARGPA